MPRLSPFTQLLPGHSIPRSARNASCTHCAKEDTEGDRSLDSPAAGGLDNTSLVGLGVVRVPAPAATTWSEHPREQAPDHAEMETPQRDNHDGSAGTSCTRIASTRMPCAEDDTAWQRALVPHPAGPRATRAASARAANPSSGFGTADCSCRALPPAGITPQVLHVPPNRPHTLFCPAAAPEREPSVLHRAGLADARVRFVFMDFSFGGIQPLYCISRTVCQKLQPSDPGCRAVVAMPRFDPQGAANFSFPSSGAKVRPATAAH